MNTDSNSPTFPTPNTMEQLPAGRWSYRHQFRHGQCDPAGIVYTPEFFNVFNCAVESWFCDHLGLSYYDLIGTRRVGLGYVNAHADFFSPVKMGEVVEIFIRIIKIGGKSYSLELNAMSGNQESLRGLLTTVVTDLDKHSSISIPEDIRDALNRYGISDRS